LGFFQFLILINSGKNNNVNSKKICKKSKKMIGFYFYLLILINSSPIFFQLAVKDTAAWAIGRLCDACERVVVRPDVLQALLPALFTALQDVPRVATNVCWAISRSVEIDGKH
jgi:hypothetical protein